MASGGKTPVTATSSGEDQGRGGTVRPRSRSPTKRPTSPPKQPKSPRSSIGSGDVTLNTSSLRAPSSLPKHQSNSVPATPHVHARRYSNEHRTPSPIGGVKNNGNISPRSVRSDSDSRVRPSGRALSQQTACKFESGMTAARRRIPYSIGPDPLENSTTPVKEKLTDQEEARLTKGMQEMYERLLPTPESEERRAKFKAKLQSILNEQWPGTDIKVHVFGSSGNLLCTTESDVDICITTPSNVIGKVCNLAQCLHNRGMERVVCIPSAKVPIVKIWDPELKLACDMNVNNADAIENTRMIRTYVQIDPRVRPLAMVVKHWTRQRILNEAGTGGTLSSYTWISLVIHYLQSRHPAVLPSLQKRPHQCTLHEDGQRSKFADDIQALSQFGKTNKETIGELLFGFFRYYGHEFDYEDSVISIREGKLLKKSEKKWESGVNNRLCVEEPFNTTRNLGNTVDDYAFRGVHLEIRRAFDLLCEVKLDECCEQYEWPAVVEQTTSFFQRPTPQPLPILSRSRSQTNRSSRSSESSGRNQGKQRHRQGGGSGRRASSAAASNKSNGFVPGAGNPNWNNGDKNSLTIHESLSQQFQLLQQQEAYYKLQMQQNQLAQNHAQSVAQVPSLSSGSVSPRHVQSLRESRRGSHVEQGPLSAPLRSLQNAYFPSVGSNSSRSGSITPGMGHNRHLPTNLSSPSVRLAPVDARNAGQRPLTPEAADMARSRSQPPSSQRTNPGQQQHAFERYNALAGYPGLQQYQQQWMQARQRQGLRQTSQTPISSPRLESLHLDGHGEDQPSEYVGYYVDQHGRQHQAPYMTHRGAYEQQERLYSPDLHRLQGRTSRSPSPGAGNFRDRSYSVQSARPAQPQQAPGYRTTGSLPISLSTPAMSGGPIIIDGSGDSPEANPSSRPSSYYESAASDITAIAEDQNLESSSPTADPFVIAEEQLHPGGDTSSVNATGARNTVQFGEHDPRPLRSFAEHASALQRQNTNRASSQSSQKSAGWYNAAEANGLGIAIEPTLAAKEELIQANPQVQENNIPQHLPPQIANGIPKNMLSNLKPAPLLSPVREVRTPSPTTSRTNSSHQGLAQGRSHHGRAVSLLSGQAALQQQQQVSQDAKPLTLPSGSKTSSPKLVGQSFSAVAAFGGGNGQSSSRASPFSDVSRAVSPRLDTNGASAQNGTTRSEISNPKPRQGSAPGSMSTSTAESILQGQPQQQAQSGWQQATKRNKKRNKGKNNSISIPPDASERKGG